MPDQVEKTLFLIFPLSKQGGTFRRLHIWLREIPAYTRIDLLYHDHVGHNVAPVLSRFAGKNCTVRKLKLLFFKGKLAPLTAIPNVCWVLLREKHSVILSSFLGADVSAWLSVKVVDLITTRSTRQVVYIAGSPVPLHHEGTLWWPLYRKLTRVIYPRVNQVLVISAKLKQLMVDEYGVSSDRVKIIPISVECPVSEERSIEEHLPQRETVFGVVSRLDADKSVDHIIQALARVLKEGHDVRLEVFGAGELLDALRSLSSELGLDGKVRFHGWIEEPGRAFREIDCLVMVSRYEGTPRSILEAGCYGVPTIAANVGGISDVITHGQTGWIFPYGDIDALANLMCEAASSPEILKRTGQELKAQVTETRTVDAEIFALVHSLYPPADDRV